MYSSPIWRTDTIDVSKLNKSPPPSNGLEINMPPSREGGGGGLIEDLWYVECSEVPIIYMGWVIPFEKLTTNA